MKLVLYLYNPYESAIISTINLIKSIDPGLG